MQSSIPGRWLLDRPVNPPIKSGRAMTAQCKRSSQRRQAAVELAMRDGGDPMNLVELNKVANAMVAPGKGILAADESTGTIKRRFDAIGVENTEDNRRDYRELLFRSADAMRNCISGVILYDETIWQKPRDGTPLVKLIEHTAAIPAIKVAEGTT